VNARIDSSADGRSWTEAAAWHGAWCLVLALAAATAWWWRAPPAACAAIALAALPGAAGVMLRWRADGAVRAVVLALWTLASAGALLLGGGLAGPLAPWILLPTLAAFLLGGPRIAAGGMILTATAAAVVALAQASGRLAPVGQTSPWIGYFALAATGAALAGALVLTAWRDVRRRRTILAARRGAEAFLAAQSCVALGLAADGAIRERFGAPLAAMPAAESAAAFQDLATDAEPLARAVAAARAEGRCEIAFAPRGAPDRWIAAILFAQGDGLVAALRDASVEHDREAALEQAARDAEAQNAGKSLFLANMSHELRTPLNAVVGFSDIMRSRMFGPLSDKYAEYASLIHESGGHLLDLINDVLDLSKIEARRYELAKEPFDAREAVTAALRLVRVQADLANVRLRGALPATPIRVDADRRAIKQIVLNLLSNALKFTPGGGAVDVTLAAHGEELTITVGDTGVGIAPADLERLGRPYEQAGGFDQKAMGTGLGLSLVRAFAELHGGAMTISSLLGGGTTVVVRLPVVLPARPPQPVPTRPPVALGDNVIAFNPHR
jgi:cell cycle sensor histidine kinase DivJ